MRPRSATVIVVAALYIAGCNPGINEKRDAHGFMQLHHAVGENDLDMAKRLFEQGAKANVQDLDGVTPLHRAARDGHFEMAKLLLLHYADPNIPTHAGWDALHLAAWNGHHSIVELLLSYKAIPNRKTPEGWNAIHLAARSGSVETVDAVLLDWSANEASGKPGLNDRDQEGRAPIHIAILRNNLSFAGYLLLKGADANATDAKGNTPLHLIPGKDGAEFLVGQLLVYGADVNQRNHAGRTPMDLAVAADDQALVQAIWDRTSEKAR